MAKKNGTHAPNAPGIYLFKDAFNRIIYVGKAKSIKKRLASYFKKPVTDWKIDALLQEYKNIDFIVTNTETEAALLEVQMIRDYQPKYNVLLKAGQPFIYILFTHPKGVQLPTVKLMRTQHEKGTYFGPFLYKTRARAAYNFIIKTFRLFICNKSIASGCLDYHLGRCAGTCRPDFSREDYELRIRLAQSLLQKNREQFIQEAERKIEEYSQQRAFEKAKHIAYYLEHMQSLFYDIETKFSPDLFADRIIQTVTRTDVPLTHETIRAAFQALLKTDRTIRTIDCFDISHFQSKEMVGSCIRFMDGEPDKQLFRRFKIRSITQQNDYAALQEIVSRRYAKEDYPDLILIDGGKGQRNAILSLVPESVVVVSLAKKQEQLFGPSFEHGILLDVQDVASRTLIALRDYAHHFAIQYHRLRRTKSIRSTL